MRSPKFPILDCAFKVFGEVFGRIELLEVRRDKFPNLFLINGLVKMG
ncbi:hypothetical protein H1R81_11410 [Emticicia sp. BO119]|nr:hypothetical protein [Emticicia sp. BO119]